MSHYTHALVRAYAWAIQEKGEASQRNVVGDHTKFRLSASAVSHTAFILGAGTTVIGPGFSATAYPEAYDVYF